MNYIDTQLKQLLVKMLPEIISQETHYGYPGSVRYQWKDNQNHPDDWEDLRDTELLHLCWLVMETLSFTDTNGWMKYNVELWKIACPENRPDGLTVISYGSPTHIARATNATWQQRVVALAKVKGIEIV